MVLLNGNTGQRKYCPVSCAHYVAVMTAIYTLCTPVFCSSYAGQSFQWLMPQQPVSCLLYKTECNGCDKVYIGETASNGYTCGLQHTDALEKQHKDSVLHVHNCEKQADAAIHIHHDWLLQTCMLVTPPRGSLPRQKLKKLTSERENAMF